MAYPELSIVVYNRKQPDACVRLLTSCEQLSSSDMDFEVVVVQSGLTEKVQSMLTDYSFSFPLNVVTSDEDINRARGRNLGVEAAQFEHILFLDTELEASPDLLNAHMEGLSAPEVLAVMGEILLPRFVKKNRWYRYLDSFYRSTRRWSLVNKTQNTPPLRYVNTSNFSLRKKDFQEAGGYSEDIDHKEAEDIDLAQRLHALNGGVIRYQPDAMAYCLHAGLKQAMASKYEFGLEGIPKLIAKYPELYGRLSTRFITLDGFPRRPLFYRLFWRLLFSAPVFFVARGVRLVSPEFIAYRMLRFMLQYESVRGVRDALKNYS